MQESKAKFDLEERTLAFAKDVRRFVRKLKKDIPNIEDSRQLVRASGSVAANYIEALEALGRKDFVMKLRITRKETRESVYWLKMINESNLDLINIRKICNDLTKEGQEIIKILTSSILTLEKKNS